MEQPNLNYIQNLSGDDIAFQQKLIAVIKEEFPVEKKTYEDCIQNNQFKETAEIVHKIKHKISILGLEKSYETAQNYEKNLKESSTALQSDFEQILAIMTDYIDQL